MPKNKPKKATPLYPIFRKEGRFTSKKIKEIIKSNGMNLNPKLIKL